MSWDPPKLPEKIFKWFCGQAYVEDLLGDLHEVYLHTLEKRGQRYANWFYWRQVVSLIFSYATTKRKRVNQYEKYRNNNKGIMFKSYLKISVRTIVKQKVFTAINILGLAMGMSIALLAIAMFIELKSFDEFHPEAEQIYRITTTVNQSGNKSVYASVPAPLAEVSSESIPGLKQGVLINDHFFPVVESIGDPLRLQGYLTQPAFLEMFSFPLAQGSKEALAQPGKTIITHELAQKLFGDKPAMNQVIKTENWGHLEIAGVLAPFPKRTHFSFDLLAMYPESISQDWSEFRGSYYYFKSDTEASQLEAAINQLGISGTDYFEPTETVTYSLQPLGEITPGPLLEDSLGVIFDMPNMLIFFGTALLILLPAVINYVNMAIAAALKRSKEVGIRKVVGSSSRQIVNQFLVETTLICLGALLLSMVIFYYLKTGFQQMLVGAGALSFEITPAILISFVLFAVVLGITTGLIPAFFFARISPIVSLRGKSEGGRVSISGIRKVLMVFQFITSLAFMIGIGVLVRQYQHALTYNYGFHKENILVSPIPRGDTQLLQNEFMSDASVSQMSFTSSIPGTSLAGVSYFYSPDGMDSIRTRVVNVNSDYIDHMGLELVEGTEMIENRQVEQILVNQTLMNQLKVWGQSKNENIQYFDSGKLVSITGIVKDYNHEPLNERIEPMVFRLKEQEVSYALFSVAPENLAETLERLETRWDVVYPDVPFKASFLDTEIEKAYDSIIVALKLFGFLGLLAVSITILGLLGMIIYTTENRVKEVAIRKTLGANSRNLIYALASSYFKLWIIALLIAVPASYIFYDTVFVSIYNKYSGGVGLFEVLVSTLFTILIGAVSIFSQTVRVMRMNPANTLRME
ncbi:ABC transporter permease [Roseivirga sp.]|uniref:ABC transporter permease n=1 Tax=Roseivirga sp. TaxID=1964215 RepID=UPI003B521298